MIATTSKEYTINNYFCNNCRNVGHSFHQCKYPITSVGLIVYTKNVNVNVNNNTTNNTENESFRYLMIRRKDSLGYIEFIRGKYPLYNKLYIQNIISEMNVAEKNKILTHHFDTLWRELWGDNLGIQYRGEEHAAKEKFESIKSGVNSSSCVYSLKSLVEESMTFWVETEWGFPKGRHNNQEKDLLCALREFEEETGYPRNSIKLVQNVIPFEEIFTGSNYKSYKHKYYLGFMENITDVKDSYQKSEVSKMGWHTYDEAIKLIRPYNLEKINVLTRVNKLLSDYRLYP
jgi:8-oxo-dGTP pyrophosphatase MutT (NUDIX family)